jgi:hypothetical protein
MSRPCTVSAQVTKIDTAMNTIATPGTTQPRKRDERPQHRTAEQVEPGQQNHDPE